MPLKRGLHVGANLGAKTVKHANQTPKRREHPNQKSASDPAGGAQGEESLSCADQPNMPPPGATNHAGEANDGYGGKSKHSHPVGHKGLLKETRAKKRRKGYRGRRSFSRRDFFEEVIYQLRKFVTVIENGKPRRMRGLEASAKNMALALMRGDSKARALFIKLKGRTESHSPVDTSSDPVEEKPKIIEQLMRDFADDIHEEHYQRLCELVGKDNLSNLAVIKEKRIAFLEKCCATKVSISDRMLLKLMSHHRSDAERTFLSWCPKRESNEGANETWKNMNRTTGRHRYQGRRSLE
jgi:hypothetical protein